MKKKYLNYGPRARHKKKPIYRLILDYPQQGDYVETKLGGSSPLSSKILQEDMDWTPFLPNKELQNFGIIEPYACVAFTILNCVEILAKKQYNEDVNYSDRFLAAISGTKEGGNSPHVVAEFLRKVGVVPQELWPYDETIASFEEFYKPIPPKLYELAREFNKKWDFKHSFVEPELIDEALKRSPLLISVYAWRQQGDIYIKPSGVIDNHATTYVKRKTNSRLVFDTYDSILKDVDLNHVPTIIKRFELVKKTNSKCWLKRWLTS